MTITLVDPNGGVEVNLGPSDVVEGATSVTIFADDPLEVELIIHALQEQYGSVSFSIPAKCADGKWGTHGTCGPKVLL